MMATWICTGGLFLFVRFRLKLNIVYFLISGLM